MTYEKSVIRAAKNTKPHIAGDAERRVVVRDIFETVYGEQKQRQEKTLFVCSIFSRLQNRWIEFARDLT